MLHLNPPLVAAAVTFISTYQPNKVPANLPTNPQTYKLIRSIHQYHQMNMTCMPADALPLETIKPTYHPTQQPTNRLSSCKLLGHAPPSSTYLTPNTNTTERRTGDHRSAAPDFFIRSRIIQMHRFGFDMREL